MQRSFRWSALAGASSLGAALLIPAGVATADTAPNGVIAYSAWNETGLDIYTVDPATPEVEPLRLTQDGRYNENADWSPDGTRIVYDGWADTFGPRIQVMDADPATDDWTLLSDPCDSFFDCYGDFQPAWSPDGTRIAFVSSRQGADGSPSTGYELYVMDATGEVGDLPQATRLTTDAAPEFGQGINDSQVTWSPDGSRIAFLSSGRGESHDACDLWAMDPYDRDGDGFGDNLQRLTSDESFNCSATEDVTPQWSPNSSLIAFSSVRTGYWDIWLVNADDPTDLRNVTKTPSGYEDQPSWSPDGTQVIFRSPVGGFYQLFSLPVPPPDGRTGGLSETRTQLTFGDQDKNTADWGAEAGVLPSTATLTVKTAGKGAVRSDVDGIRCGKDCLSTYVEGSTVTLTAKAKRGYVLTRWRGDCSGSATTCVVTLDGDRRIRASFKPAA